MDPATAFAQMVKAVAEMITEIVRGQPMELRARAWERWERDTERWRKLFKLDEDKKEKP